MAKANKDQEIADTLARMEAADLIQLSRTIDQQIGQREAQRRQEAVSKLSELAKQYGLTVDQLFELARGRKNRSSLPPRYRHPEDRDLTWTGRGRRPQWLLSYIGDGGALEDLRV